MLNETPALSGKESKVFAALSLNHDTEITEIYDRLCPGRPAPEFRAQQQYVGKYIARINRKLTKTVVRPGVARRTYRLYFV